MAVSLPITWTATIVTCSHCVGLTLPGMMDDPGSFSGMRISPRPSRGPEASQRTSLAIFIISAARAFTAPWANTISSLLVSAWNLFAAVRNSFPVIRATCCATFSSNPLGAFSPVPTAVPPRASSFSGARESRSSSMPRSTELLHPLISWEKRIGTASCRCVLPDLTTSAFSASRRFSSSTRPCAAGSSLSSSTSTAEMCIAVGNVSLEDWLILMSSLGWQSFSPAISLARLAITSLAFILD